MTFDMGSVPSTVLPSKDLLAPGTTVCYDGNNYARVTFETDTSGLGIRRLIMDIVHNPAPTIVVFDGKNAKAERRKVYPGYKLKRPPASDDFYRVLDFWKELLIHTHAIVIEVPGYEADDVIAMLARSTTGPFQIRSTDRDYCVLVNELVSVPGASFSGKVEAKDVRLYKTMVGDNSDDVPGIKGFGDKTWAELSQAVKTEMISFLNGKIEWTDCLKKESHNLWVRENTPLLRAFWKVVDFLPIPPDQFQAGMRIGSKDLELIESKLAGIHQGVSDPGRSVEYVRQVLMGVPKL